MKISISCNYGTWRPVHLARELDDMGHLKMLYVPYYRQKFPYSFLWKYFKLGKPYEIDLCPDKVTINLLYTLLNESIRRNLPYFSSYMTAGRFVSNDLLDKSVSKKLDYQNDVVIAQSEMALHTIRKAKEKGAIGVLDRTNSHIEYQTELLKEEYRYFGQEYTIDERVIKKGVQEYEEADYIFVLSSFAKKTLLEKGVREDKVISISPGVDLEAFHQIDKKDDVFRIVYCGGIGFKKGVHYLVKAFSELKLKNAELWLIGSVNKKIRPFLKEYEGAYRLIGFVPNKLLYKYYSQSSVFVLPSIEEGFGKVILEAMSCGLPAIVTTNTAAGDVVRDGKDGFIIPIRDVEALKEKITYLYENRDSCKEMGSNAKKRVRKDFTWEAYAKRVTQVCEKVIAER